MLIMHPMNNLKTESRISVIFMIPKTNKSIMWKHVGVEGKDVDLVIKNVSPEIALPEMEVIPNIHIFSAMSKWTQGVVRCQLPRPEGHGLPLRKKSRGVRVADSSC